MQTILNPFVCWYLPLLGLWHLQGTYTRTRTRAHAHARTRTRTHSRPYSTIAYAGMYHCSDGLAASAEFIMKLDILPPPPLCRLERVWASHISTATPARGILQWMTSCSTSTTPQTTPTPYPQKHASLSTHTCSRTNRKHVLRSFKLLLFIVGPLRAVTVAIYIKKNLNESHTKAAGWLQLSGCCEHRNNIVFSLSIPISRSSASTWCNKLSQE